jgi:hypothetical protein
MKTDHRSSLAVTAAPGPAEWRCGPAGPHGDSSDAQDVLKGRDVAWLCRNSIAVRCLWEERAREANTDSPGRTPVLCQPHMPIAS